jgi:hypothetical protein
VTADQCGDREGGVRRCASVGKAAIDDGDRAVDLAQIPADPPRAEPVDAVGNLVQAAHPDRELS